MAPAIAPRPTRVVLASDSSHLPGITATAATTARRRGDLERVKEAIRRRLLVSASPVPSALPPERGGDRPALSCLSTGVAALDRALGGDGLPRGVLTEITGPL